MITNSIDRLIIQHYKQKYMNALMFFNKVKRLQKVKHKALFTFSLFSKSKAIISLNVFLQNNQ